ncbi:hypothetical protein PBI_CANTARE_92 [Brevibacterium phage Cantare]|uniref:Uncharacterized protein n=1 Tax=Brevibacterium phage Cantare TaxID=2338395 RepID=A0A3G3LYT6_9CAUD|nr:hypothetical protein PQD70_gp092 [Brevibacterium phage Cantare]AYQ99312.1 hypothetical protein PBI_CANTARE_92 [Brevibacterium phage Cantare]
MTKAEEIFIELTTGHLPLENVSTLSTGDTVVFRNKKDESVYSIATLGSRISVEGTNFARWREAGSNTDLTFDGLRMEIYVIHSRDIINEVPGTVIEATILKDVVMSPPVRLMFVGDKAGGVWASSEIVYFEGGQDGYSLFKSEEINEWEVVLLP